MTSNEKILDLLTRGIDEIIDKKELEKFKNIRVEKITLPVKCRSGITKWNDEIFSDELKNTCRIYPQDNNTEGFFIAKLKNNAKSKPDRKRPKFSQTAMKFMSIKTSIERILLKNLFFFFSF